MPQADDVAPDLVLGQPDASSVQENRGGECSASTFYWPFGIALVGSTFWVADTGNRRLLGWRNGIPDPDQPADIVLGQPDPSAREENRGGAAGPASFRWPHDITGNEDLMLVADAGDHRILGWSPRRTRTATPTWCSAKRTSPPPTNGRTGRTPTTGSGSRTRCLDAGGQERSDSGIDTGGQERSDSGIDTGGQERSDSGLTPPGGLPSPTPPTTGSCCGTACRTHARGRSRRRPRAGSTRLRLQRREPLDLGAARHAVLAVWVVHARRHPGSRRLRKQPGDGLETAMSACAKSRRQR